MEKKKTFLRDLVITVAIMAGAALVCFVLSRFVTTDTHVPMIFVLAVLFISRLTNGYAFGLVSSVIAVFGVNYAFTYPYFRFNFTLTGYPLTFLVMLAVSLIVSALTTQIKKQEEIRLLMEKEKLRGNLLRAVSHDLRTPLTAIVGSVQFILDEDTNLAENEKKELLIDIQQDALWLNRMVENLLSVTRINNENPEICKKEELVEEVIAGAVMHFEKRCPEITIHAEIPEEPILLAMDPLLIEQVLVNLLDNAVRHGEYTDTVTIHAEEFDNRVRISVADNGKGIDREILPQLFDGTLPLQKRDTEVRGSIRIGLSVCKSVIKAHNGRIWAENSKTGGAIITFELPKENGSIEG